MRPTQVQDNLNPKYCSKYYFEKFTPSLITLFKFLGDGQVRTKVGEIVNILCPSRKKNMLTKMLLGNYQPFLNEPIVNDNLSSLESKLQLQAECHRKLHSFTTRIEHFKPHSTFVQIFTHTNLSAIIEQDGTLIWEGTTPKLGEKIQFENEPCRPKQVRLFIMSHVPAPDIFWQAITSCKILSNFPKILNKAAIRQMILTYDIIIMESSSVYTFTSANI